MNENFLRDLKTKCEKQGLPFGEIRDYLAKRIKEEIVCHYISKGFPPKGKVPIDLLVVGKKLLHGFFIEKGVKHFVIFRLRDLTFIDEQTGEDTIQVDFGIGFGRGYGLTEEIRFSDKLRSFVETIKRMWLGTKKS